MIRRGPDGQGAQKFSEWEQDSVIRLGAFGIGLATIGLVVTLVFGSGATEGEYVPARYENGKLIPGGFNPPE